jgi:hypothetical protein
LLFDVGGAISAVAMAAILVYSSIKNTHTLYELERLPKVRSQRSEVRDQRSDVGISPIA